MSSHLGVPCDLDLESHDLPSVAIDTDSNNLYQLSAPQKYSLVVYTLLKKFKGAHSLWQIAVQRHIPNFDNKIQNN